ncbi:MAG: cytochrome c [bacterium]|nr:cytochrome c [bacterium]
MDPLAFIRRHRGYSTTTILVCLAGVVVGATFIACSAERNFQDTQDGSPSQAGHSVYVELKCGRCHGEVLEGTRAAPPLSKLASHWDQVSLTDYILDPDKVRAKSQRLVLLSEPYAVGMAAIRTLEDQELDSLVGFLLTPNEVD